MLVSCVVLLRGMTWKFATQRHKRWSKSFRIATCLTVRFCPVRLGRPRTCARFCSCRYTTSWRRLDGHAHGSRWLANVASGGLLFRPCPLMLCLSFWIWPWMRLLGLATLRSAPPDMIGNQSLLEPCFVRSPGGWNRQRYLEANSKDDLGALTLRGSL